MPVYSTHPEYDASLAAWVRARDVLAGEDAVKAAGKKYLTDTAPASSPATDAAATLATDPQLPGHPPVLLRLTGATPRAYSAFTAFFLLGQAPTSSAQSPTASPSPRISANSAASNQISFSGHEKSQKVTKSHLPAQPGGPTPRHPAKYACQPRREASQRTSPGAIISPPFSRLLSHFNPF